MCVIAIIRSTTHKNKIKICLGTNFIRYNKPLLNMEQSGSGEVKL